MCCGDPCACSGYRSSISRVACWGIAIQTLDTDCVSTQVGKATFATPDSGNSWTGQTLSAHGTHQAGSYLETDQVSTHALPGEQSRQTQSQKPCSLNSAVGGAQLAPLLRKRFGCGVSLRGAKLPQCGHTTCESLFQLLSCSTSGSNAHGSQRHFPRVLKVNIAEALWLTDQPRVASRACHRVGRLCSASCFLDWTVGEG